MHIHYKGTGKVHSFRGLLAHPDGTEGSGQDKIRIQGPVGAIAWRITKFELMGFSIGSNSQESTVKIFRETQSSVTGTIDFTNGELLAAGIYHDNNASYYPSTLITIMDNALFTRDIYITQFDVNGGAEPCNYYIELEEVKVGKAGMAQLAVAAARRTID